MAVVVVERFKQEVMYGLSAGAKKVAVVERWPLVEFDCSFFMPLCRPTSFPGSLLFPLFNLVPRVSPLPPLAPWDVKRKGPVNEVVCRLALWHLFRIIGSD